VCSAPVLGASPAALRCSQASGPPSGSTSRATQKTTARGTCHAACGRTRYGARLRLRSARRGCRRGPASVPSGVPPSPHVAALVGYALRASHPACGGHARPRPPRVACRFAPRAACCRPLLAAAPRKTTATATAKAKAASPPERRIVSHGGKGRLRRRCAIAPLTAVRLAYHVGAGLAEATAKAPRSNQQSTTKLPAKTHQNGPRL
jgi:hypothetical protein